MRKAISALAFLILVPALALAESAQDSWDNLRQLQPGQKVEVVDAKMKTFKGEFVSFTEEAISLREGGTEQSVERTNVVRVSVRDTSKRTRNLIIGAAIGAGAGLAISLPVNAINSNEGGGCAGCVAGLTAALAGAGAGLGAIPGNRTVYRTKK